MHESTIPEMVVLARDTAGWRSLVEHIKPEDTRTLEIQKRKTDRGRRNKGTSATDLDAATWLK